MKVNAVLKGIWYLLKFCCRFFCDILVWFFYNVILASVPVLVNLILRAIAGLPIDLNNITPDLLLVGYSIACTVLLYMFNKENNVNEELKNFITVLIFIFCLCAIGVYSLFYIETNIETVNNIIHNIKNNVKIFLISMAGLLFVLSLTGAFAEAANKRKKRKQKKKQLQKTAQ